MDVTRFSLRKPSASLRNERDAVRVERDDAGPESRAAARPWHPLSVVALAALTLAGIWHRLQDPLSTRLIAAEDPYTHIVFTKEDLARGYFDASAHLAFDFYPPGLHAFLGALHAVSGLGLYELARLLPPVLFGGLAVATTFVAVHRLAGPVAATAAAGVLVAMPEHVFRTNLLFPTALDLALLPFLFLAAAEVADGRPAWAWVLALLGGVLVMAHPWAILLVGGGLLPFVALHLVAARRGRILRRIGSIMLLGATLAALAGVSFLVPQAGISYEGLWEGAKPRVPLFLAAAAGGFMVLVLTRIASAPLPRWFAGTMGAIAVGVGLSVVLPRLTTDLPIYVSYEDQLGPVPIALALAGAVLVPLAPSRVGLLGWGFVAATLPLTAMNVFDASFWPHRTVAYLAVGVAFLAGGGVRAVQDVGGRFVAEHAPWRLVRISGALVLGIALAAGSVTAAASPYEWYRLYDDESHEAFEWTVHSMEADADIHAVSAHWKSNVILKALAPHERVHWGERVYEDPAERASFLEHHGSEGHEVLFLVGPHHRERAEEKGWDLSFLEGPEYEPVKTGGPVTVYHHVAPGG